MSVLDRISEHHPLIERLAGRGVIANYDGREVDELKRAVLARAEEAVALRPESRHIIVGRDHSCVGQNLWRVAVDDKGLLYKCGGKLCGQPEFAYGTARDWDPADPLATASKPDMLSRFLNTAVPPHDDKCYECAWLPLCGGGCPQLRLFGKPECPAYRSDPDAFVLAMYSRLSE